MWKYWDIGSVDIEQYNYRLNEPTLVDAYGFSILGDYFQGYQAAHQYAYDVLTGVRVAGQAEIAACERYIYDLQREDLVFDTDEVDFILLIANQLKHPKGALAGEPFRLLPFMQFILAQMFGWFYSEKARETLRYERRFIKTSCFVARGNSKTCLAAVASIANILTNENGSPTGICAASVTKQARLAFEDITKMIKSSAPSIRKRFEILRNEIRCPDDGRIIIASSEADTLDGIRGSGLQLCDEIHAHSSSAVVDVLSTGMQSSKNPQMLMISTAGTNTQGYGREIFDYSVDVAKGAQENDRFFSIVYTVDAGDEADWNNEAVWVKANPALGHAVSLEGLRAAYSEATRNASARANFLTKHLNVWCDFDEANYVDSSDLFKCRDNSLSIDDYVGKVVYLGLDIASVSDLSSLVYIFPNEEGGVDVFQKSYLPESALMTLKPSLKSKYYEANKKGELIFTPSEITDMEYIANDIVSASELYDVQGISIDAAAGGTKFAYDLFDDHQLEAVAVKQGFGLSEPAVMLQALVKSGGVRYNSDLFEWCMVNALVLEGSQGDIRVVRNKADHSKKIDVCIATVIGLSQTILQSRKVSVYETQGLRFI
ncbi:terminase large subunit [Enterovibrio calviensis]|uniref:terminase large subunit n=1 Tax=Enterovibrio calviensis TaxID=91359 RepID=UPI000484E235|nr:terminase TerL endonuclease subunit [Enterovibrio calviensis]